MIDIATAAVTKVVTLPANTRIDDIVAVPPLLAPSGLRGSASSNRVVALEWAAPASPLVLTGYRIEAGSRPNGAELALIDVADARLTAVNVPPGRYFIRVRALSGTAISSASNEIEIVVPP